MNRRRLAAGCVAAGAAIAAGVALSGDEPSPPDPVVVRVELEGATSAAEVVTGFVAGPGRVVTVAHVLRPDRRLVVRGSDGRPWRAHVLRRDVRDDLALVAVDGLRDVTGARMHRVATGGTPLRVLVHRDGRLTALPAQLTRPIRATLHRPDAPPQTRPALQLRAHVALGDSGAPVVDGEGRVAGVLFARASDEGATAYAVDSSAVTAFLSR